MMLLLTPMLVVPAAAGLLCVLAQSRRLMEAVNVAAFGATVALAVALLGEVLAHGGQVTEVKEFLRADALSAWMALLISIVSLGTSLYSGRYLRRDLAAGALTPGRVKEFYVLTPFFATGMFLVV